MSPPEREQLWAQLMRRAQQADRVAYEQLLGAITPFLRSFARRSFGAAADAEDVAQEVLVTLHRVRHTWDPARPFTPWLIAIAQRRVVDHLRRRGRVDRNETHDPIAYETFSADGANTSGEDAASASELQALLSHLPPRQRQAVEIMKIRQLSLQEAAAESGQSIPALKVNVHRALKTLRKLFGQEPDT